MKLKFINCLLAVALCAGSAQTLTSCKDYDEDQFSQLENQTLTIQQQHDKDIADLQGLIGTLNGEIATLKTKITDLDGQLAALKANVENNYVTKNEYNTFLQEYAQHLSDYQILKNLVSTLETRIQALEDNKADKADLQALTQRVYDLETWKAEAIATLTNLNTRLESVEGTIAAWEHNVSLIPDIQITAQNALAKAEANETAITNLWEAVNALKSCDCDKDAIQALFDGIAARLDGIDTSIDQIRADLANYATKAELNNAVDNLMQKLTDETNERKAEAEANLNEAKNFAQGLVNDAIAQITGGSSLTIKDLADMISEAETRLKGEIDGLASQITDNLNRITALEEAISPITNRLSNLENRISSIELQGTINPITGYFNTPFGVNSNLLLGYAGSQDYDFGTDAIIFPYWSSINNYTLTDPGTKADLQRIAAICGSYGKVTLDYGKTLVWGNINSDVEDVPMGKVYMTVNPGNINLTGKNFNLVNSQGTKSAVDINVIPSDYLLNFGYSRSAANGFYEGIATVPYSQRNQVKLSLKSDFKDAVLDVLKNPTSTDLGTVATLAKATYNQFTDVAPALGVQAAWTEDKDYTVTSKYGVGAVLFEPLSYRFLYGEGSSKELPLLPSSLGIDFTVNEPVVSITEHYAYPPIFDRNLTISMTVYPDYLKVVIKNFPVISASGTAIGSEPESAMTLQVPNVDMLLDGVMNKVKATINTNVPAAYRAALLAHADTDLRTSLEAAIYNDRGAIQVAQSTAQVLGDIRDQVMDQVNRVNDILNGRIGESVNKLIKRVNKALKDPNHYLQPTMFLYNGSTLVHVSNAKSYPTAITGTGALTIVPTTFTAEVLSPAWAKYVAVSNVYTLDMTKDATTDATCKSLMVAANKQTNMNKPFDGDIRRVPFEVTAAGKDHIYEFIYSALDFRGCASTQKFYVTIK